MVCSNTFEEDCIFFENFILKIEIITNFILEDSVCPQIVM